MKIRPLAIGTVGAVALAAIAGGVWWASADDDVVTYGNCSTASYEFEVEAEDNDRLEVNFELLAASVGEEWTVTLSQNGDVIFTGIRTADAEAEIDVDVTVRHVDGDNRFVAEFAPAAADREPCRVEITH